MLENYIYLQCIYIIMAWIYETLNSRGGQDHLAHVYIHLYAHMHVHAHSESAHKMITITYVYVVTYA